MHPLDLLIIVLYFLLMIAVGWWVAKKATKDSESYSLAGKSLPWWVIGVAHGRLRAGVLPCIGAGLDYTETA
jgi:Na+/proline symporter